MESTLEHRIVQHHYIRRHYPGTRLDASYDAVLWQGNSEPTDQQIEATGAKALAATPLPELEPIIDTDGSIYKEVHRISRSMLVQRASSALADDIGWHTIRVIDLTSDDQSIA